MNYTEHLKELLKNITPINENTRKYPDEETAVIDYRRNPLSPSLFSYCFKKYCGTSPNALRRQQGAKS